MKGKKLLAGVLSAAMVLGTMALPVFADESNGTDPVEEFKSLKAQSVNNTHEIDLKGETVNVDGEYWSNIYADITIKNGTINFSDFTTPDGIFRIGYWSCDHPVTLTLENMTINVTNVTARTGVFTMQNQDDTLVLKNSKINATGITSTPGIFYTSNGENSVRGSVKITGGSMNVGTDSALFYNNDVDLNSTTISCTVGRPVFRQSAGSVEDTTITVNDVIDSATRGIVEDIAGNPDGTVEFKNSKVVAPEGQTFVKANTTGKVLAIADKASTYTVGETVNSMVSEEIGVKLIVASINGKSYATLADAVAAAQNGDTVELLSDASGNGVVVPNNSNLTIDFNGFTYNIDGTTVGSSGTETNGFQLLKGSNITFKDGTITSEKAKILIQNYSDLTLENMTLDGSNLPGSNRYVLSNNCGDTVLKGNTNIIAKEGDVAFDCFYWPNGGYSEGVTVTLGEDFTGKIYGAIEKTHDNSVTDEEAASNQSISISGGTFTTDVSAYCVDGFSPKLVNGKYVVDNSADTLKLTFKKHTDDERVYDIVLNGDGKDINRLNTVHFTFDLDNPNMTYAIKTAKGMSTIYPDNNEYVFYYDGKDGFGDTDRPDTAQNITIGTVTFDGFGVFTFKATAGKATATTTADNLVTEFVTTAEAGKGTLKIGEDDNMIKDAEIKVPTQKLTVNVAMEHNVGDNTEAYQDMTVAISGGDLAGNVLEYKLGDAANTAITKALNGAMVASYQIKADLTKDRIYTVTVSGAGYRTSRYTVTMTEDKTMNFWNNDKTNEVTVIDDEKAKTTFLAGELVRDGKIDIYDLSAVVAYFGQKNIDKTQASKFAKYDLNRDGEIDIMDISIVLTSWGK